MCVYSMIADHYFDKWQPQPWFPPQPLPVQITLPPEITREEFDQLKREVEEMKALLKRARQYDDEHDHPDCEKDDRVAVLRKIAEMVGIDLSDVVDRP